MAEAWRPSNRVTLGGLAAIVATLGVILGAYYTLVEAQTAHATRAEDRYARRDDLIRIETKLDWIIRHMPRSSTNE